MSGIAKEVARRVRAKRESGRLTYNERKHLPQEEFAIPETRSYPIPDIAHARDALARVSANGTDEQKARVRAAVHRKFPQIDKEKK